MGHYSSFILRLWVEPDNGWRWGTIEHVATRKKVRFLSPDEILEFIAAQATVDEISLPFTLEGDNPVRNEPRPDGDDRRPTTDDGSTRSTVHPSQAQEPPSD